MWEFSSSFCTFFADFWGDVETETETTWGYFEGQFPTYPCLAHFCVKKCVWEEVYQIIDNKINEESFLNYVW